MMSSALLPPVGRGGPVSRIAFLVMNPTIRDVLRRRVRRLIAIGLGGWLVFALAAPRVTHWGVPPTLPLLLGFGVFAASLVLLQWTRCPECRGLVGQWAIAAVALPWRRGQVHHCPCCGVGFDEPAPQKSIE